MRKCAHDHNVCAPVCAPVRVRVCVSFNKSLCQATQFRVNTLHNIGPTRWPPNVQHNSTIAQCRLALALSAPGR